MSFIRKNLPVLVAIIFGLTPILWFWGRGNVLINGVDTNFPLDPIVWFGRRFFVWNSIPNAGIDFSSSTSGLFFHLIQVIPHTLGFGLQQVQITSLVFWFLLIVFSSFLFARIILPKKPVFQLLFVVFYAFNIYLFNTWENVKVANLSLVAGIPLALSVLVLLKDRKISYSRAAFYSILVGIVVSGSGINPSYLASFFFVLVLFSLALVIAELGRGAPLARIRDLLFVSAFIFLINSFWILPTTNFVLGNVSLYRSIDKIGFTNWVDSLSENTSLLNVMRMQGAWDWYAFDGVTGLPLYIPYALNYFHRFPFIAFSLLIPALAIISFLLRDRKKNFLYLAFALMLVIGIFLGAGTHLPSGTVFRWLLNNVPLFTLFRSPWYIFTPLVFLSYAGLISLLFYNLDAKFSQSKVRVGRAAVFLAVLVLVVGNFLYTYPLVTGKIFRPGRHDSFYLEFPPYVFAAGEWLSQSKDARIIGYPDDEIEEFEWGYRGIESVLALVSDRETLFAPLNLPDAPVARVIKQFYQSLKKGQVDTSKALAAKLGVGLLFEKKDQESLAPDLPAQITSLPHKSFGGWNFYQFPEDTKLSKIFSPHNLFFAYPHKKGEEILGALETNGLLVNPEDTVVSSIPEISEFAGGVVFAENSQAKDLSDFVYSPSRLSNRLLSRDLSRVDFSLDIPKEGVYQPVLERYHLEEFGLGTTRDLEVEIDGVRVIWEISQARDSYLYFKPIRLLPGKHKISLKLQNPNLINGGNFEAGSNFEEDGEGEFEIVEEEGESYLSILNKSERDISANFPLSSFDPMATYLIELRYKQVYGNNATVLASQSTAKTLVKTQVERLPNYPEWGAFSFYYEPVKTDSKMRTAFVAPFTEDPLGTKVLYDNLVVYKVFSNDLLFVREGQQVLSSPKIDFDKISPVLYEARVGGADGSHIIVFSENYSPEWELIAISTDGKKLATKPLHFSANLYANAWYIEDSPKDYKIRIYYRPQNLFNIGIIISGLTIVFGVGWLAKRRTEKKSD